jgi:hypothetical protein
MRDDLIAVGAKIASVLAVKPECFITHPAELRALKLLNPNELLDFAEEQGWHVVRRIGGRQIEFYNDASARAAL